MKQMTTGLKARYQSFFADQASFVSTATALLYLLISLIINYFACQYAYVSRGNSVTDIVLDNIPVMNVEGAFVAGTLIFLFFVFILLVSHPKKIPFVVKTVALFVITRSFFITLTHLGPSPLNTLTAPGEIGRAFTSGADLFFSGHTGMPFLFALMYWKNKTLRYIFFISSCVAAFAVLVGHVHYSIDVASAFFITYGIFVMAWQHLFKKDWERFNHNQ